MVWSKVRRLMRSAAAHRRGVALAKSLGFKSSDPLVEARAAGRALSEEGRALSGERAGVVKQYGEAKLRARAKLTLKWPELANLWLPEASTLLSTHADEVRASIERTPEFRDYVAASDRIAALNARGDELMRREAKLHRLIERAASVILAANLPKVADAATVRYHDALVAREDRPL